MDNFLQQILSFSFPRRWNKADTIGTLTNWDSKLQEGWIRIFDFKSGSHSRFSISINKDELDSKDISFIEYFLSDHKTICKTEKTLVAFGKPKVKIKKQNKNILTFIISDIFIKYKHTFLTNTSTVAFLFDLKVDSIDSIIKEFCINFLIDEKYYETLYNTIGQEMIKIYNNWTITNLPKKNFDENSTDENKKELETIII
tara:strand:+ start:52 stop:651 length:600 start_codon:yes stop_codon:yes gene_type:complete